MRGATLRLKAALLGNDSTRVSSSTELLSLQWNFHLAAKAIVDTAEDVWRAFPRVPYESMGGRPVKPALSAAS